ncbi:hypothetical protein KBY97_05755 [Synechococcus sp. ATX 2A4]|nr:hypothetical protein [Synechococcus sp. ATX 2A4]MCP9884629.1 hypothetical protein [Synechococcus sp. ATX 2A4]
MNRNGWIRQVIELNETSADRIFNGNRQEIAGNGCALKGLELRIGARD